MTRVYKVKAKMITRQGIKSRVIVSEKPIDEMARVFKRYNKLYHNGLMTISIEINKAVNGRYVRNVSYNGVKTYFSY